MSNLQPHNIIIKLKNADLAALSAKEAIKTLLGVDDLLGLNRYRHFRLAFGETPVDEAKAHIKTLMETSYTFMNPNKETYQLEFAETPDSDEYVVVRCEVSPREKEDFSDIIRKINDQKNIPLTHVHQSVVWELKVASDGKSIDEIKSQLMATVIKSTAVDAGLLCNPIYETAHWIDEALTFA